MTPNVVQFTRRRLSASFPCYHYRYHQYEVGRLRWLLVKPFFQCCRLRLQHQELPGLLHLHPSILQILALQSWWNSWVNSGMTPNLVQLNRRRISASFTHYYCRSHQYEVGGKSVVRHLFHFLLVSIAPFCYQRPQRGLELYLIPSDGGETRWKNHNNITIHRTEIGIYLR